MMHTGLIFAAVILLAVVIGTHSMPREMQASRITEGQTGTCNKRLYSCYLNPCQTRANTCRDPRECRPDYCGGCKTKCVTTTPVPERAIVGPTTRHPPLSAGMPDYCDGCKAICATTSEVSERVRSQARSNYCDGCKTKCFTTTPVPERAVARLQTRASGLPFSTRRPDSSCRCKPRYVTRNPKLGRIFYRFQRPCRACSSSRRT